MAKPNPNMPQFSANDVLRFWAKVNVRGSDDCWEWKTGRSKQGYGVFHWHCGHCSYRQLRASRVAYYLHYKEDPGDHFVCHTCDNPSCCNPGHLFKGDSTANNHDMITKGRHAWGEKQHSAKLTRVQVVEIRKLYRPYKMSQRKLAARYGVAQTTIGEIIRRTTWAALSDEPSP